jgi:hypothetical protein
MAGDRASPNDEERAFVLYRVENRTCKAVSRELEVSTASVIRMARRFERDFPERAAEMLGTAVASAVCSVVPEPSAPAGFMAAVRARVEGPAATRAPSAPPAATATELDDVGAASVLRQSILDLKSMIDDARSRNDATSVGQMSRTLAMNAEALRKLEKTAKEASAALVLTHDEVDAARASIAKLRDLVQSKKRVCADCGREMRMRAAMKGDADESVPTDR